jgi:hypothetical protein
MAAHLWALVEWMMVEPAGADTRLRGKGPADLVLNLTAIRPDALMAAA